MQQQYILLHTTSYSVCILYVQDHMCSRTTEGVAGSSGATVIWAEGEHVILQKLLL